MARASACVQPLIQWGNMYDNQDVYTKVTNKVIADLEKGELTWR
jgi:antirestriction protein ArdC